MIWRLKRIRYERFIRRIVPEPHTILFESYGGRSYACSPRALFEALCEDRRFDGWRFIWSFREPEEKEALLPTTRAILVRRMSGEYLQACARATYWITNNRMPEFLHPRPDQTYVQCWHGTPLKRLGFDVAADAQAALNTAAELAGRFAIDAEKWSWLLSPSPYTSEHLTSAFGRSADRKSLVIEEGYPRNDAIVATLQLPAPLQSPVAVQSIVTAQSSASSQLPAPSQLPVPSQLPTDTPSPATREAIETIKRHLGVPLDKKVVLYAPTWRDDSYQAGVGYTQDALLDFEVLQRSLGADWVILLRAHYYIANRLNIDQWQGFVYDMSRIEDVNDLYIISDALLTDYSSVLFDFANTSRPLLFYWPDLDHYGEKVRGFYFDPETLPGPQCRTSEEVASALGDIDGWHLRYGSAYEDFKQTFCPKDDGNATKRVIERLFKGRF
jgi:CDP-glycerol glycerophosphotransferase